MGPIQQSSATLNQRILQIMIHVVTLAAGNAIWLLLQHIPQCGTRSTQVARGQVHMYFGRQMDRILEPCPLEDRGMQCRPQVFRDTTMLPFEMACTTMFRTK